MPVRKYINLNDYTLLEDSSKGSILFYPESAILKQKVENTKDTLYIKFEFERGELKDLYTMYVSLISSKNEQIFKAYSIYLKEIALYKYIILDSINDFKDAEVLPGLIIDFNKLDYNNFLHILANNKELSKMVPYLKTSLEEDIKELAEVKNIAQVLNVQSPTNYYQNVTGTIINEIEGLIGNEEEEEISKKILKNFKKNFELALVEPNQIILSYLSILAGLLIEVKSNKLNPKTILDSKELKTDTNKDSITYKDLISILDRLVEKEKNNRPLPEDLNIIQERIVYLIETKPRIKKFNNLVRVILASEEYIKKNPRYRCIDENKMKELLLQDLNMMYYRVLPRNQILIFNKNGDNVDFIAIFSQDKIISLFDTYLINRNSDAELLKLEKKAREVVERENITKDIEYIKLLIINTIKTSVYYNRNVSSSILLFNKGDAIIDLDYKDGEYEISVINKKNEKKLGTINKLSEDVKEEIKANLTKSEKSFIQYINNLIFENLYLSLTSFNYEIIVDEPTHKGIKVKINKSRSNNSFSGEFDLDILLTCISEIKELKTKVKEEKEEIIQIEPEEEVEEEASEPVMSEEDRNQIIRKASAIAEVMNTQPIDNDNYKTIAEIYNEYRKTKNEDLLPTIQELLEKNK